MIFLLAFLILASSLEVSADSSATEEYMVNITVHGGSIFKADIALLIDESGSVSSSDYLKEIEFCKIFVNSFTVSDTETRFALIWFSNNARWGLDWYNGNNQNQLMTTLSSVKQVAGGTNFEPPLRMVQQLVTDTSRPNYRPDASKIVILVTDGAASDQASAEAISRDLRNSGVLTFAVGIGAGARSEPLAQLAGDRNRLFSADNFDNLKNKLGELKTAIMKTEVCTYHYHPTCLCYYNQFKQCIQLAKVNITHMPDSSIQARSLTDYEYNQISCNRSKCEELCNTWPWAAWEECEPRNGIQGEQQRRRNSNPPGPVFEGCDRSEVRRCVW